MKTKANAESNLAILIKMGGASMKQMPQLKDVMTPFPHFIDADDSLEVAKEIMRKNEIRHLPVKQDGQLIGMLSDRDVNQVRAILSRYAEDREIAVSEVLNRELYTVPLNARLDLVLGEMAKRHLGSALVMKGEKLAGIFTTVDACKSYSEFLRKQFHCEDTDTEPEIA